MSSPINYIPLTNNPHPSGYNPSSLSTQNQPQAPYKKPSFVPSNSNGTSGVNTTASTPYTNYASSYNPNVPAKPLTTPTYASPTNTITPTSTSTAPPATYKPYQPPAMNGGSVQSSTTPLGANITPNNSYTAYTAPLKTPTTASTPSTANGSVATTNSYIPQTQSSNTANQPRPTPTNQASVNPTHSANGHPPVNPIMSTVKPLSTAASPASNPALSTPSSTISTPGPYAYKPPFPTSTPTTAATTAASPTSLNAATIPSPAISNAANNPNLYRPVTSATNPVNPISTSSSPTASLSSTPLSNQSAPVPMKPAMNPLSPTNSLASAFPSSLTPNNRPATSTQSYQIPANTSNTTGSTTTASFPQSQQPQPIKPTQPAQTLTSQPTQSTATATYSAAAGFTNRYPPTTTAASAASPVSSTSNTATSAQPTYIPTNSVPTAANTTTVASSIPAPYKPVAAYQPQMQTSNTAVQAQPVIQPYQPSPMNYSAPQTNPSSVPLYNPNPAVNNTNTTAASTLDRNRPIPLSVPSQAPIPSQPQQVIYNNVPAVNPFHPTNPVNPVPPQNPYNNYSLPLQQSQQSNQYQQPQQPQQQQQSYGYPPSNLPTHNTTEAYSRPPPASFNSYSSRGIDDPSDYSSQSTPYGSGQNTPAYHPDGTFQQGFVTNNPMIQQYEAARRDSANQQQSSSSAPKKIDRIDPKQIPRPAEFKTNTIRYYTRSGTSPPSAAADYQVIDEGNCSPRFVRLTTNNVAHEAELIDQTKLCIGAIIQPLAPLGEGEEPIPVINYSPLRCSRCMAYVNPFFQFIDQGANFNCNLCGMKNEVPVDYRCNLDGNGYRRDRLDRPELCRGSVEFTVGKEFLLRPISDPCYLFVLDVSYGAQVSGAVTSAIQGIRNSLTALAQNPRIRIGLITYDSTVQYYSLKSSSSTNPADNSNSNPDQSASMFVMCDIDDVFVPCPPESVLVHIAQPENRMAFESLLDMLPTIYDRNKTARTSAVDSPTAFGAAVAAAAETLLPTGGKVLIVQTNLPQAGCGALTNRDSANLYNTDKERSLQLAASPFYTTIGTKCADNAITVDVYVCSNSYVDIATIGSLCEKTGGQIFFYPGFNIRKDGAAFECDIYHNLTRYTGYDGIMVVRCTSGLKVAEYFGNFYHRRVNEMDLPTIDSDKTFGIRLEHEQKLKDKTEICIQTALLYTTNDGIRRIRVHTISVPVTSVMSNIFRFADLDAIINLSLKQAVRQLLDQTTNEEAQNALTNACIDSLFIYRKFCASATSAGQLILPEPLKLLPLCTLGLIKHSLLQDGVPADERAFLYHYVNSMPNYVSVAFICPRLFSLHDLAPHTLLADPNNNNRVYLPAPLTLSSESISPTGLYLLDDGRYMYLYIGAETPKTLLEQVFDLDDQSQSSLMQATSPTNTRLIQQLQNSFYRLRKVEDPNHLSYRINLLIDILRKQKSSYQNLQIITRRSTPGIQSSQMESLDESLFFSHLIEDAVAKQRYGANKSSEKGVKPANSMSYIDFLCWIHKKIQNKFY